METRAEINLPVYVCELKPGNALALSQNFFLRSVQINRRKIMQTCPFNDFLKVLEPWLDRDYIRKVYLTDQDHLVFFFTDGGQKAYHIDDCTKAQLKTILADIREKGIPVEKAE